MEACSSFDEGGVGRFKRLCQRTSWKNILVTLSLSHQLWLAWRFETNIPNMCKPEPLRLIQKEMIEKSHKLHSALFKAIRLKKENVIDVEFNVVWLEGVKFQGLEYKIGGHLKIANGREVHAASLVHVLQVQVHASQEYILIYHMLLRLAREAVPSQALQLYGASSWYVSTNLSTKKRVSCLSFVDIHRCTMTAVTKNRDVHVMQDL